MTRTVLFLFIFCSCSANWHIQKAKKKNPALFDTTSVVTIDTIIREIPKRDTLVSVVYDTLVKWETKEKAVVSYKFLRDTVNNYDTLEISVDCPDCKDVVRNEVKTQTVETYPLWIPYSLAAVIAIILIYLYFLATKD